MSYRETLRDLELQNFVGIDQSAYWRIRKPEISALSLVDGVVINSEIQDILPNGYQRITPEFLIENTFLTMPTDLNDGVTWSPRSYRRALVPWHERNPMRSCNSHCYDTMLLKGVTASGASYNSHHAFGESSEPTGYFGVADAQQDMDDTNMYLSEGCKMSIGLGYVVLNHDSLRILIENTLGSEKLKPNKCNRLNNLSIVEENGDTACVYFRYTGSPVRLDNYIEFPAHTVKYHLDRAFRLMQCETGKHSGEQLNNANRYDFGKWVGNHIFHFERVMQELKRGKPTFWGLKDVDLGGVICDFERGGRSLENHFFFEEFDALQSAIRRSIGARSFIK